jgi:hypothetical protein
MGNDGGLPAAANIGTRRGVPMCAPNLIFMGTSFRLPLFPLSFLCIPAG